MPRRILILGGYGTFGGRLARLLADEENLTLVIAGRSLERAREFCASLKSRGECAAVQLDRETHIARELQLIGPEIVVDASGPFQAYGDDPYQVVKACLALGINYLDIADGSDFVKGVAQFDAEAKLRKVFVLSGASSFPVLTAAVMRQLTAGMQTVTSVAGGIAPSPYAGVGLNVIRSVASYGGKPVKSGAAGEIMAGYGLLDTRRFVVRPPGQVPLPPILFSLVDVPDLQVLPEVWPSLRDVWMGAGPVPEILHRVLNATAWTVKAGILPSLSPFASLMHRAINVLRWGEHRGGMIVAVAGTDAKGQAVERSWHLLAEGDDGPFIPSMACDAIIRNVLADRAPTSGARSAIGDLEVADYEKLFAKRRIFTGRRQTKPADATAPLYQRMLGEAWEAVPEPIKAMHDLRESRTVHGLAKVTRGESVLARLVAALFRFPEAGDAVPVEVTFQVQNGEEVWERQFGGRSFKSLQREGTGRLEGLLEERFGVFAFGLALVVDGGLRFVPRRWSVLGLPLPTRLIPRGEAYESADDGRFNFHVEIGLPLIGPIVGYEGWLEPADRN
ncbi:MAG TPA: DUF4166 domain-containing protein [Xanthobacteraceae bacterium]|nr:DUF4166 domain-containing protein [Xanthobacteraceae bacterium]